ncbi:hypothetical protein FRC15_001484, partial [Serendipita sp. 397]
MPIFLSSEGVALGSDIKELAVNDLVIAKDVFAGHAAPDIGETNIFPDTATKGNIIR